MLSKSSVKKQKTFLKTKDDTRMRFIFTMRMHCKNKSVCRKRQLYIGHSDVLVDLLDSLKLAGFGHFFLKSPSLSDFDELFFEARHNPKLPWCFLHKDKYNYFFSEKLLPEERNTEFLKCNKKNKGVNQFIKWN